MIRYILGRLGSAVLVLFVLSVLVFMIVRLIPGDPTSAFIDPDNPDPAAAALIREELGLNRPWFEQYFVWIFGVLSGDLGRSLTQPYNVADQLAVRFPVSLELGLFATIIGVALGIPLGLASAVRKGRAFDMAARISTFVLLSVPAFVLGTFVLLLNSQFLRLRLIGFVPFLEDPLGNLSKLLLPSFLLSLALMALVARYTRSTLLDTFSMDYVRTARSKGVPANQIVNRHALRNAIAPVLTIVGVQLATLVGGTVIMENVFALPGMGSLLISAINQTDYPTIQAAILLIGAMYVGINLIVDLLYPLIDPRIRVTR